MIQRNDTKLVAVWFIITRTPVIGARLLLPVWTLRPVEWAEIPASTPTTSKGHRHGRTVDTWTDYQTSNGSSDSSSCVRSGVGLNQLVQKVLLLLLLLLPLLRATVRVPTLGQCRYTSRTMTTSPGISALSACECRVVTLSLQTATSSSLS